MEPDSLRGDPTSGRTEYGRPAIVVAPYIAIALTGLPAAYRSRGVLRWWILYEVVATVALKVVWVIWHIYDPLWRVAEPIAVILGAGVALSLSFPTRWPMYAVAAGIVHGWALGFPNVWPGDWLQAEIHSVAFCHLLFGLFVLGGMHRQNGRLPWASMPVAAIFLLTAAGFYAMPWHMDLRVPLMWEQAGCYLWIALAADKPLRVR